MREVFYTTREERQAALQAAQAQGETMVHDDFNVGPAGEHRLIFDILPNVPIPPSPFRQLLQRVDAVEARLRAAGL